MSSWSVWPLLAALIGKTGHFWLAAFGRFSSGSIKKINNIVLAFTI